MITATIHLYKQAYAGLTRRIWLLGAVMLINRIGTMVLAFMTLYISHLGYSIEKGGQVVAIYGIGSVLGAFIGGKLSDKVGFYYTQFFALFFGGVLFIVLGQMSSFSSICICTFFLSTMNESFRPANATAIAHYSNSDNRTQSFSLIRLAVNIGFSAGTAIAGLLASINYHLLFWVDGLTSILAGILLLVILPVVPLKQQRTMPASSEKKILHTSPYKDKTFLFFVFFLILFAICFFQLFTTVPVYFKNVLKLDEFWIGIVMATNGILIALVEMVLVFKLEGRKPYLVLISMGCFLMCLSFLMLNFSGLPGLLVAMGSILMLTFAEMISMPFMNSYYIGRSNHFSRGQYAGVYTMAWSVAQVIGSGTGSLIAGKYGFFSLWWMVGFVCLLASAGFYWLKSKK